MMNGLIFILITFATVSVGGCIKSHPKSDKAVLLQEGKTLYVALVKYEMAHGGLWPKRMHDANRELQKIEKATQTKVDLRRWVYHFPDAQENLKNDQIILKGQIGKAVLLVFMSGDVKWE